MGNKYQEALNELVYFADPFDQDEFNRVERWGNTLQQAIDDLELYKKALDKACEIISCENCPYIKAEKCNIDEIECKKCWKEYLLKEVEK